MDSIGNPYSMQCAVCGRILIGSNVLSSKSIGLNKLISLSMSTSANVYQLICPNNHGYSLIDITSATTLESLDIQIDRSVVENFKREKDFQNFDLKHLIHSSNTKMYVVSYSVFARVRSDKFYFGRKPSPSNQILDSIILYIFADTTSIVPFWTGKNIIFAVVGEKAKGTKFIYKIVWYYFRGV